MRIISRFRVITLLFMLATVVYAYRTRRSHGSFLGVPFEFRLPTPKRLQERLWNPSEKRLFTPHVFGVGWSLNVHSLLTRLGLLVEGDDEEEPGTSLGDE